MNKQESSYFIKESATQAGFDYCGIARAVALDDEAARLEQWLRKGYQGSMSYMDRYFDLRVNPCLLVPGAKSVVTLLLNYYPTRQQQADAPGIAKYAYGKDYHDVIKSKLNYLHQLIKKGIGDVQGRGFVDSAPVLERTWATRSGLGWIGKNTNLLTKRSGSFFFIASLVLDLELAYDDPFIADFCGTCQKCVDACPTGAILEEKVLDATKCISYFTIELKDALLPTEYKDKFENWLFGCDICQDVCPWNRFSKPTADEELAPCPEILNFSTADWEALSEQEFKRLFGKTALRRAKFDGIKRNLNFILHRQIPENEGSE